MFWSLFEPAVVLAYVTAAALLVVAPGPAQALVIARSIEGGWRAGLLTCIGLEIGTLLHTLAAALGLSALLAGSATAFAVIKYVGALYLIVLGILTLRRAGVETASTPAATANAPGAVALVVHAALTGTLNPKVAVFFVAFLPQFVQPERGHVMTQFLLLGAILALLGLCVDAVIACLAARAGNAAGTTARFTRWRERLMGSVLLALGLRLVLVQRP